MFAILLCFLLVQEEPTMSWSDSYRLQWDDFKAPPNTYTEAVAVTASGITFGFSITQTDSKQVVDFDTEVHAHFYPEQSWYKTALADDQVLGHEQLHFDITELHARKFRERIQKLKASNQVKRQLKDTHNQILKELEQMQNKYDAETDYSRNVEMQEKWQRFVDTELKKHANYKSMD